MKRLIVCSDGTWQKLDSTFPSNIVKLAQAIKPVASDSIPQIVFYDEGIGTEGGINKWLGGAFGRGIDKNIEDGYRFLCLNYEFGDEIYLFGFSRGAYTVRSLAGMIYNSGLLSRADIPIAPRAYELYRDRDLKPDDPLMVEFRQQHGDRVPITLLACLDTVGALGLPNATVLQWINRSWNQRYSFHDTKLSKIINHALHAVAIDETRKAFCVTPMTQSNQASNQTLRQVWFPGSHGCVGGGTEALRGLSDRALQWMIEAVGKIPLNLEFDVTAIPGGFQRDATIDFSAGNWFTQLGGTKYRQVSNQIQDIDSSTLERWRQREDYRPHNQLIDPQGLTLPNQTLNDLLKNYILA